MKKKLMLLAVTFMCVALSRTIDARAWEQDQYGHYMGYGYEELNERQKEFYDEISEFYFNNWDSDEDEIWPEYEGAELGEAQAIFLKSNPQYNYNAHILDEVGRKEQMAACKEVALEWLSEAEVEKLDLDDAYSQRDFVLRLITVMSRHIIYTTNNEGHRDQFPYDTMVNGKGVCAGYATSFHYLCALAGLETRCVGNSTHEWNAIRINGNWYGIDSTWADVLYPANQLDSPAAILEYAFAPQSIFSVLHIGGGFTLSEDTSLYIPSEEPVIRMSDIEDMTDEKMDSIIAEVLKRQDIDGWYYFVYEEEYDLFNSPVSAYISDYMRKKGMLLKISGDPKKMTHVAVFYPGKATESIGIEGLEENTVTVKSGDIVTITAVGSKDSDDIYTWVVGSTEDERNSWRYGSYHGPITDKVRIISDKKEAFSKNSLTLMAGEPGTTEIEVTANVGQISRKFTLKVLESAEWEELQNTIWANGKKGSKTKQLTTQLTASKWTDSKGKEKTGKIVWLAMSKDIRPEFDANHKLVTQTDCKQTATVSSKGVVTAKGSGTVYVYAIDTGSMNFEKTKMTVKTAPKKIVLADTSGTKYKKINLKVGDRCTVTVVPTAGTKDVPVVPESSNTYIPAYGKPEQNQYYDFSEITKEGTISFTVTGKGLKNGKATTSKVTVTNAQGGKKVSVSVQTYNPTVSVSGVVTGSSVAKKGSTGIVELTTLTYAQERGVEDVGTTDTFKVIVATDKPVIAGTKVTYTKGSGLTAKLSKNGIRIDLKATKDLTEKMYVYVVATNKVDKEARTYLVAEIIP